MKRTAGGLDSIIGKVLEDHRHRKRVEGGGDKGYCKQEEEQDFMDVMLKITEDDGPLSGHDTDKVIKATTLVRY